ncbi:hypothetical protein LEP1GSC058_1160 [Leptospira fainei serovar Hurstbridge str. BUT 6]|uniref:Uncharacterized protein n=1 Tax=Leptospira fainei serovar Hurstbridge str. BUT 6 TaxID=1193011 RepID=S3UWE9_9LEPT|nr:hypothetical protein LEP1GSC058_1160 [Leptospira fainei serovar Hurstbridge str. BUT 6]
MEWKVRIHRSCLEFPHRLVQRNSFDDTSIFVESFIVAINPFCLSFSRNPEKGNVNEAERYHYSSKRTIKTDTRLENSLRLKTRNRETKTEILESRAKNKSYKTGIFTENFYAEGT